MKIVLLTAALSMAIFATGCISTSPTKDQLRADLAAAQTENLLYQQMQAELDRRAQARRDWLQEYFEEWQMREGRRAHRPGGA